MNREVDFKHFEAFGWFSVEFGLLIYFLIYVIFGRVWAETFAEISRLSLFIKTNLKNLKFSYFFYHFLNNTNFLTTMRELSFLHSFSEE